MWKTFYCLILYIDHNEKKSCETFYTLLSQHLFKSTEKKQREEKLSATIEISELIFGCNIPANVATALGFQCL